MKNILVALAPAIASAIVGFVIEVGPHLKKWMVAAMQSRPRVETLKEIIANIASYGSLLGGALGFHKESPSFAVLSVVWFIALFSLSFRLANRVEELEEADERRLHRKNAGLLRSIVRSEIERARSAEKGKNSDLK